MTSNKRLVLFVSGDYYDSASPVLEIPAEMDLAKERIAYRAWLETKKRKPPAQGYDGHKSFLEWLQEFQGACDANIEEFDYD